MRPTPETDAEIVSELTSTCYPKEYVSGEFARKLERERDEAIATRKASATDWLNQLEQANARVSRALQQVAAAERERDEARGLARNLYSAGDELRRFTAAYAHNYDEVDGKPGALEAISDFYDASKDIAKILAEEVAK